MRDKMNRSVDRQVFKRTAASTKAVNLQQVYYRGGIRL